MKKVKWPIHKSGKNCGYDEFEDGSIGIAPMYARKIQDALESEKALDDLLAAVTKQCHALFIPITRSKKEFWDDVVNDYGLDLNQFDYSYDTRSNRITKTKKAAHD